MSRFEVVNSKSGMLSRKAFPKFPLLIGIVVLLMGFMGYSNILSIFESEDAQFIGTYEVTYIGKYETTDFKPTHLVMAVRGSNGVMIPIDFNIYEQTYNNTNMDATWVGEAEFYESQSDGDLYIKLGDNLIEVQEYSVTEASKRYESGEWVNPLYSP